MSDKSLRDTFVSALKVAFEDLQAALDRLNSSIKDSVPVPPMLTPPRPKVIAPQWVLGIIPYRGEALNLAPRWLRMGDNENESSHVPKLTFYKMSLVHVEPSLPHPSQWRDLISNKLSCDAVMYRLPPDKAGLEMICISMHWYPHRIEQAIRHIQSFSQWCDRMREWIPRWCESQRSQDTEKEAIRFIEDLLVEKSLQGGQP